MNRWAALKLLLICCIPSSASAITIEEAYGAIPHRQTTFRAEESVLDKETSAAIETLMRLVDRAIVERVQTLQWYQSAQKNGQPYSEYKNNIDVVLTELEKTKPPETLVPVQNLIHQAISEQRAYFEELEAKRISGGQANQLVNLATNSQVKSSHQKLINAYNILMRSFPYEGAHNKQAFFDHLCALDFL